MFGSNLQLNCVQNAFYRRFSVILIISCLHLCGILCIGFLFVDANVRLFSVLGGVVLTFMVAVNAYYELPIACNTLNLKIRSSIVNSGLLFFVNVFAVILSSPSAISISHHDPFHLISNVIGISICVVFSTLIMGQYRGISFLHNAITIPTVPESIWHSLMSMKKQTFSRDIISGLQYGIIASSLFCQCACIALLAMHMRFVHAVVKISMLYPIDFSLLQSRMTAMNGSSLSMVGEQVLGTAVSAHCLPRADPASFAWNDSDYGGGGTTDTMKSIGAGNAGFKGTSLNKNSALLVARNSPFWKQVLSKQLDFVNSMLAKIKPTTSPGMPILPAFYCDSISTRSAMMVRMLGYYEFSRISRAAQGSALAARRRAIFANSTPGGEFWPQLAHAACSLVDLTSIQIQLASAYGIVEVLSKIEKSTLASDKYTAEREKHCLPHTWHDSRVAATTAMDIVLSNKSHREKQGTIASIIDVFKGRMLTMNSLLERDSAVLDPIPIAIAQSVVFAVESLSLCMNAALSEDPRGCSIHFLPAILSSFVALKCALSEHKEIVKEYCLCNPLRAHRTLSSFPRRGQLTSSVSASTLALSVAVDEALVLVLRGYRDQLSSYAFPPLYATIMQDKLKRL